MRSRPRSCPAPGSLPSKGDKVHSPVGSADSNGSPQSAGATGGSLADRLGGGYASFTRRSEAERSWTSGRRARDALRQRRAACRRRLFPRLCPHPCPCCEGEQQLLFPVARGRLKADSSRQKPTPFSISPMLPRRPRRRRGRGHRGGRRRRQRLEIRRRRASPSRPRYQAARRRRRPFPALPPLAVRKIGFRLKGTAPKEGGCEVALEGSAGKPPSKSLDRSTLKLGIAKPGSTHKRTFRSGIDGSVHITPWCPPWKAREIRRLDLF